ncbi:MAG: DUF357 domain-containing protein [Candidatus Aenigmarchaeota archaeon]|nr:DUF357 domain-containing protein [Candidatus Aenigmarchaeota archaeon]
MDTAGELKKETEKWLSKIEKINFTANNEKGEEFKTNIEAYVKDSKHFSEQGDLVRAFEAVIWAWAFLEISDELKLIERG